MRSRFGKGLLIALGLLTPLAARANPYILDPSSLLAFCVVAFWALIVEAGIVALLLGFLSAAPLRIFVVYFMANGLVFLFVFQPLLERHWPLLRLELMVVVLDACTIKFLVSLDYFQGDNFTRARWWQSLVISSIGNLASFFVGHIANQHPWQIE